MGSHTSLSFSPVLLPVRAKTGLDRTQAKKDNAHALCIPSHGVRDATPCAVMVLSGSHLLFLNFLS